MPPARGMRITVLVEDEALRRFAWQVLVEGFRFARHNVYITKAPEGCNAKQWIDHRYPDLVKAYRRKASHQEVGVLIGTDADEQTVAQRGRAMAERIVDAGMAVRGENERIVLWIPKWHIETWILALTGEAVDETTRYKRDPRPMKIPEAAERFVGEFRRPKEERAAATLPSLAVAYDETERLA